MFDCDWGVLAADDEEEDDDDDEADDEEVDRDAVRFVVLNEGIKFW